MPNPEAEPHKIVVRGDKYGVVDDQQRDVIAGRDERSAQHYADLLNKAYRRGYRLGYRDAKPPAR